MQESYVEDENPCIAVLYQIGQGIQQKVGANPTATIKKFLERKTMKHQITAEELRKELDDYLSNTSEEQLREELENRKHLKDVLPPINPKNIK